VRPASLAELFSAAATGPVLEADVIPIANRGKLRVTDHWLYSALNCDPADGSSFLWVFTKLDERRVAISPKNGPGRTVYASVRDDWSWYVQVQAPRSADWITAVARNETLLMTAVGLQMIRLQGFNGQFIAVDGDLTRHQGHSGYRLRSGGSSDPNAYTWFLGIKAVLQAGLELPKKEQLTADDVRAELTSAGLEAADGDVATLHRLLS
jgi:hypothetical protein